MPVHSMTLHFSDHRGVSEHRESIMLPRLADWLPKPSAAQDVMGWIQSMVHVIVNRNASRLTDFGSFELRCNRDVFLQAASSEVERFCEEGSDDSSGEESPSSRDAARSPLKVELRLSSISRLVWPPRRFTMQSSSVRRRAVPRGSMPMISEQRTSLLAQE